MNAKEEQLQLMRIIFNSTTMAFNIVNQIQEIKRMPVIKTNMQLLHQMALDELNKETPDIYKIDSLLAAMVREAEKNQQNLKS